LVKTMRYLFSDSNLHTETYNIYGELQRLFAQGAFRSASNGIASLRYFGRYSELSATRFPFIVLKQSAWFGRLIIPQPST
jgi:hypothetical protein